MQLVKTSWVLKFLRLFSAFTKLEVERVDLISQIEVIGSEWQDHCLTKEREHATNEEDLIGKLNEAAHARIKAEDDARFWRARAEIAESRYVESVADSKDSIKKIANFEAIRNGNLHIPFPEVFVPLPMGPDEDTGEGGYSGRPMSPRARQMEAVAKSRREASEKRKRFRESLNLGEVTESALNDV